MPVRVAVIATVLNEADSIAALQRSLLAQTRQPDEVILVDGGSTDGTWTRLQEYAADGRLPLRVYQSPGCNISQGRNLAIRHASAPVIAATDAGVRLEETWLERLVAPFEATDPPDVVSGFFVPDPQTTFEAALGAATLPRREEIVPERFNPSSRSVAFRRQAWEQVEGYPEWLDYCEDLLFDLRLREAGCRFAFAPEALAHFRPRANLAAFYKQYYRYARGDGKAGLWLYRHLARYATYLGAGPVLVALAIGQHPAWLLLLLAGLGAMLRKPLRRVWAYTHGQPLGRRLAVASWVPLIVWTGDVAKMLGYVAGLLWRLRHKPAITWPTPRF